MSSDIIRRLITEELPPVNRLSTIALRAEVRDWITNRKAGGYDVTLLEDVLRHLTVLTKLLSENNTP